MLDRIYSTNIPTISGEPFTPIPWGVFTNFISLGLDRVKQAHHKGHHISHFVYFRQGPVPRHMAMEVG